MENRKTDLRVIRTKQSIRKAFCEMIIEMEYSDISVKELTQRAMINRNTFYLHYSSIDALLDELRDEIADKIISMYVPYHNLADVKGMLRSFFEYVANSESGLLERIVCSGSYRFLAKNINEQVMRHRRENLQGVDPKKEAAEEIILSYYGTVAAVLFRSWVMDGKKLTLDELIDLSTDLICHGIESVIEQ